MSDKLVALLASARADSGTGFVDQRKVSRDSKSKSVKAKRGNYKFTCKFFEDDEDAGMGDDDDLMIVSRSFLTI